MPASALCLLDREGKQGGGAVGEGCRENEIGSCLRKKRGRERQSLAVGESKRQINPISSKKEQKSNVVLSVAEGFLLHCNK